MFTEAIEFGSLNDLKESIGGIDPKNCLILSDENTYKHCVGLLGLEDYEHLILPSGEGSKTLESCQIVWDKMLSLQIDRKGTLVNVGGGVITDLGAYCASIYKRGIDFVNVPTSLMAMVDAAIGGKTGINYRGIKNPLGTFADAEDILICPAFLQTLPEAELTNGFAEIIKHALIADVDLWEKISQWNALSVKKIEEILQQAISVKTTIVDDDPFESGERKKLNFGHTIGHAIEANLMEHGDSISHGQAVAIGMFCESYISLRQEKLEGIEFDQIKSILKTFFPLIQINRQRLNEILSKMGNDKKNDLNGINCTLLEGLGTSSINNYPEIELIQESLLHYLDNYNGNKQ